MPSDESSSCANNRLPSGSRPPRNDRKHRTCHADASRIDENRLIAERRSKLDALRLEGIAFPNDFRREDYAQDLQTAYADAERWTGEALEAEGVSVALAGRLLAKRVMGKAAFAQVQDMTGRIQLFLQASTLGERYDAFKSWDIGDIVAATGTLMRTKTGELSVRVDELRLLTKSLRPLPDKWHGLTDVEQRYRQRQVDLIVSPGFARRLHLRSRIIAALRRWLDARRFLEVETPMMHYDRRRRGGQAVRDAPQRAGSRPVPARGAGAVSQAPGRRRLRARLRNQPQLPQRRRQHPAQPRVHDAGALRGYATYEKSWT